MPTLLLAVVLALQDADQRAAEFFDRIQFEAPSPETEEARRVAELLLKKEHWVDAYRQIERRLGPMPDGVTLKVDFTLEGEGAGWGGSNGREARVRFNLKQLAERRKKMDEIEAQRKEAESRGQRLLYRVPPMRIDRVIHHELTHVFQRSCDAPAWFVEGMAQLMSEDPNNLSGYAHAGKKPGLIDEDAVDKKDTYARGHTFWKWLDSRGAAKKAAGLVVIDRRPWKEALEEATGFPWALLATTERLWSMNEVEKIRAKDSGGR